MMMGLAGSQGPRISFLYFCNPISHQLHPPVASTAMSTPTIIPTSPLFHGHPPVPLVSPRMRPTPSPAPSTSKIADTTWNRQLRCLAYRRKTGNRPKTSMLNSVKLKTCFVDGSRLANTVDAMRAALVESDAGNLAPTPPE